MQPVSLRPRLVRSWPIAMSIWLTQTQRLSQLNSLQETDSSADVFKRTKQHHVNSNSRFDLHSPKARCRCFRKQHGHVFCLLSKEACLYAGADCLSSTVSQRVARSPLTLTFRQATDSSAHLDKRSKQHHLSWSSRFDLHSPKRLCRCL